MRTCVGCRRSVTKKELLRVVASQRGPGLSVVPDPGGRAPGRGAYLHLTDACLRVALRRRAFPRALRVQGPLAVEHLTSYVAQFQPDPDRNDREMWSSSS